MSGRGVGNRKRRSRVARPASTSASGLTASQSSAKLPKPNPSLPALDLSALRSISAGPDPVFPLMASSKTGIPIQNVGNGPATVSPKVSKIMGVSSSSSSSKSTSDVRPRTVQNASMKALSNSKTAGTHLLKRVPASTSSASAIKKHAAGPVTPTPSSVQLRPSLTHPAHRFILHPPPIHPLHSYYSPFPRPVLVQPQIFRTSGSVFKNHQRPLLVCSPIPGPRPSSSSSIAPNPNGAYTKKGSEPQLSKHMPAGIITPCTSKQAAPVFMHPKSGSVSRGKDMHHPLSIPHSSPSSSTASNPYGGSVKKKNDYMSYKQTSGALGAPTFAHVAPARSNAKAAVSNHDLLHPARVKRDIMDLYRDPPPGILAECDEENMTTVHAVIIGSEGTPYEGGFFYFVVKFPHDYPFHPPQVKFMTTGGGLVQLNPNLYKCGKVCLSILGTWNGPPWCETLTVSKVLLSVQALVLNEAPYHNEPHYEKERIPGESKHYNDITQHETIRVAVIGMVNNEDRLCLPKPLMEKIKASFLANYGRYEAILNSKLHLDGQTMMNIFGRNAVRSFNHRHLLQNLRRTKQNLCTPLPATD